MISDLFDLDVKPRFALELLLAQEVSAGACWLHVVGWEEGRVLTRQDTLRGRHIAGLAGAAESLAAATELQGQDGRGGGAGAAGRDTET